MTIEAVGEFIAEVLKQSECPLVPAEDHLILRMDEKQTMSHGLYIPDNAKDAPQFATVLAVGHITLNQDEYTVGDRVVFGKYNGNVVTHERKEYLVLNISSILAKVRK